MQRWGWLYFKIRANFSSSYTFSVVATAKSWAWYLSPRERLPLDISIKIAIIKKIKSTGGGGDNGKREKACPLFLFLPSPPPPPPQHKEASGEERGLIQTLTSLCSLRPDFGHNTDWLLEQCHKIWLAVGITRSWKYLFLAWLFLWIICRRQREGSILLSFLLFYGLMIEKYALRAMEIQKKQVAEMNPSASCWPRTRCLLIY